MLCKYPRTNLLLVTLEKISSKISLIMPYITLTAAYAKRISIKNTIHGLFLYKHRDLYVVSNVSCLTPRIEL